MEELKKEIDNLLCSKDVDPNIVQSIKHKESIDPFSTEARLLAYMLSSEKINYSEYEKISDNFCERNNYKNRYLKLFDMAPRTFGQTWGEKHIRELFPEFIQATRQNLSSAYPSFDGEFDLWLKGIRVEVKACRANSTTTTKSLGSRAYSHNEAIHENFKYHYQQLKPSCCDVFIWIGVCKDVLLYWVLTSSELQNTGKLGSQHRNENTGVKGSDVFEGQVFMTEEDLKPYQVTEQDILAKVKEKGNLIEIKNEL